MELPHLHLCSNHKSPLNLLPFRLPPYQRDQADTSTLASNDTETLGGQKTIKKTYSAGSTPLWINEKSRLDFRKIKAPPSTRKAHNKWVYSSTYSISCCLQTA